MRLLILLFAVIAIVLSACKNSPSNNYEVKSYYAFRFEILPSDIDNNMSVIKNAFSKNGINLTQYGPTVDYPELPLSKSRYLVHSDSLGQVVVGLLQDEGVLSVKLLPAKSLKDYSALENRLDKLFQIEKQLRESPAFKSPPDKTLHQ